MTCWEDDEDDTLQTRVDATRRRLAYARDTREAQITLRLSAAFWVVLLALVGLGYCR